MPGCLTLWSGSCTVQFGMHRYKHSSKRNPWVSRLINYLCWISFSFELFSPNQIIHFFRTVFDPNESIDENNEEYKKIYDEYKHLVDFMLGSFMEEMQITPEQFEVACLAGKHSASGLSFHQGLFQQVLFKLFQRIFEWWIENDFFLWIDLGSKWYPNICANDDTTKCWVAVTSIRCDWTKTFEFNRFIINRWWWCWCYGWNELGKCEHW